MMKFREVPIQSKDAQQLIHELNVVLTGIIGNDGSGHVNPADFGEEKAAFFVGYEKGEPLCCAGIRCMDALTGEIKRVYARKNQIGAGKQLLRELERWAAAQGYEKLVLECRSGNPHAIEFYKKYGYAVCDQYPPYVGVEDAVCMQKYLTHGVLLETDRLILRELRDEDFEALYAVLADSDMMRHYPYIFDEKRVRGWIEKNKQRYQIFGFGLWAVCLRDSGEMIGDCGLTMQNIGGMIKPEIGYHLRRDMQRKGYAGEAAKAVRDWTFRNTPFQKVYSYMKSDNLPSIRCAMSYGCHFDEEYTDEDGKTSVYVLTKAEWEARERA